MLNCGIPAFRVSLWSMTSLPEAMSIPASRFFSLPPEQVTPAMEAAFFSSLKTGNSTFKKTAVQRFGEIDGIVSAELAKVYPATTIDVLDIGVSSGTTTLELEEALRQAGMQFRITATDRSFAARIVDGPLGSRALIEPGGHILQFEVFGLPVRAWDRRLDRFTGRAVINAAMRKLIRQSDRNRGGHRDVELVSPRLKGKPDISLTEDDVLARNDAFVDKFHFVRAANILNRDYFREDQLRAALGHLRTYLNGAGSLLLVLRTDKVTEKNHGTLFRMDEARNLEIVCRFGEGSEVESLVALNG